MKKIAILFIAAIFMLSIAACGGKTEDASDKDAFTATVEGEATEDVTDDTDSEQKEIALTEVAFFDEEFKVSITGIEPEHFSGYTLDVEFENKSEDKTYEVSILNAALDGVECYTLFMEKVSPKVKINKSIHLDTDILKENGFEDLTEVSEIELSYHISRRTNDILDSIMSETFYIYPYGEENAKKYVREAQASDTVLFEDENISITAIDYNYTVDDTLPFEPLDLEGFEYNSPKTKFHTLSLYFVNKSDMNLSFTMDEIIVNGVNVNALHSILSLPAGHSRYENITWLEDSVEENDNSEVEKISFVLDVEDKDNHSDILSQTITFKP